MRAARCVAQRACATEPPCTDNCWSVTPTKPESSSLTESGNCHNNPGRPKKTTLRPKKTTLRLISLSPRGILQWPEEQSRSGCGQDGGNTDQSQHRRMWRCRSSCPLILARLTSLPTFLLTTSPSPAPGVVAGALSTTNVLDSRGRSCGTSKTFAFRHD